MGGKYSTIAEEPERQVPAEAEGSLDSQIREKVQQWLDSIKDTINSSDDATTRRDTLHEQQAGEEPSCTGTRAREEQSALMRTSASQRVVPVLRCPSARVSSVCTEYCDARSVLTSKPLDTDAAVTARTASSQSRHRRLRSEAQNVIPAPTQPESGSAAARRPLSPVRTKIKKQSAAEVTHDALKEGKCQQRHFRGDSCYDPRQQKHPGGKGNKGSPPTHRRRSSANSAGSISPKKSARQLHRVCSQPRVTAASLLASPGFMTPKPRTLGQRLRKGLKQYCTGFGNCLSMMCLAPDVRFVHEINNLDGCITRADMLDAERLTNGNEKLKKRLLKELRKARKAAADEKENSS